MCLKEVKQKSRSESVIYRTLVQTDDLPADLSLLRCSIHNRNVFLPCRKGCSMTSSTAGRVPPVLLEFKGKVNAAFLIIFLMLILLSTTYLHRLFAR